MADAAPQDPWVPPNTFGARLAVIRQAKGWNVKQAAEHCQVPEQSWHNWEDGKSPRDLAAKAAHIAKAVPCDYVWLLAGVESRRTRSDYSGKPGSSRKADRTLTVVASNDHPSRAPFRGSPLVSLT